MILIIFDHLPVMTVQARSCEKINITAKAYILHTNIYHIKAVDFELSNHFYSHAALKPSFNSICQTQFLQTKQSKFVHITMNLLQYISKLLNTSCPVMLDKLFKDYTIRHRIIHNISQFGILKTQHTKHSFEIKPHFISHKGANRVMALNGFNNITVEEYFFSKHNLVLKHPNLPCIATRGGNEHVSFYPLEILDIFFFTEQNHLTLDQDLENKNLELSNIFQNLKITNDLLSREEEGHKIPSYNNNIEFSMQQTIQKESLLEKRESSKTHKSLFGDQQMKLLSPPPSLKAKLANSTRIAMEKPVQPIQKEMPIQNTHKRKQLDPLFYIPRKEQAKQTTTPSIQSGSSTQSTSTIQHRMVHFPRHAWNASKHASNLALFLNNNMHQLNKQSTILQAKAMLQKIMEELEEIEK